jgi:hypothetical protein
MKLQTAQARIAGLRASRSVPACGTRSKYIRGCKCDQCKAANCRYNLDREQARKRGDLRDLVDATAARKHILKLSKLGIGWKTVADTARLTRSTVRRIKNGAALHIRKHNEKRILDVDQTAAGDATLVSAKATWKLLNELLEDGYTRKQLAKWLGSTAKVPALQIKKDLVTARNAMKVELMYKAIRAGKLRRD